jgi:hypothetical protein
MDASTKPGAGRTSRIGGTGQAIVIAYAHKIPIINLQQLDHLGFIRDRLNGQKSTKRFRKNYSQIVKFELYNRRDFREGIRINNGIHREYTSPNRSGSEFDDQSCVALTIGIILVVVST